MLHEVGTVLAQRYEILASIGQGGMGAVYRGKDRMRNRVVAIKQMRDDDSSGFDNPQLRARFEQEWQILKKLQHPRIPQMYDAFQQDGSDYFVMEFVEGDGLDVKLSELRGQEKNFPEVLLLEYALQILDVLNYMHGLVPPLLHRDIKPQNIIVRYDNGELVLVDFGLAREGSSSTTKTMVGTLGYAPLEQVKGHPEARSDLYALGATMWHLLTGLPPNPFDIPPVESIRPDVHPALAEIVNRSCQDLPSKRFASALKMEVAVRQALTVLKGGVVETLPPPVLEDDEDAIKVTSVTARPMPASRFLVRLGGGSLLALGALLGVAKLQQMRNAPPPSDTHSQGNAIQQQRPTQATAPTANAPQSDASGYKLDPPAQLTMRKATEQETTALKNLLPGWDLMAVVGGFSPDGDLQADAHFGAVILLGHKGPVNITSLTFRILRPSPIASVQVQLRGETGDVKLGLFSAFDSGHYINAMATPGKGGTSKVIAVPADQTTASLPIRVTQEGTSVKMQVGDATEQSELPNTSMNGVAGIQCLIPPANLPQRAQLQGLTISP